jgi:hypothetical protein
MGRYQVYDNPVTGCWTVVYRVPYPTPSKRTMVAYGTTEADRLAAVEVADLLNRHAEREWV